MPVQTLQQEVKFIWLFVYKPFYIPAWTRKQNNLLGKEANKLNNWFEFNIYCPFSRHIALSGLQQHCKTSSCQIWGSHCLYSKQRYSYLKLQFSSFLFENQSHQNARLKSIFSKRSSPVEKSWSFSGKPLKKHPHTRFVLWMPLKWNWLCCVL